MPLTRTPVLRGPKLRSGVDTVIGCVTAATLSKFARIPTFKHEFGEGYQRNPDQPRVNRLAADLAQQNVDLPTAVLLSLRNVKFSQVVKRGRRGRGYILRLDPKLASTDHSLYVVDGQHRLRALEKAMEEDVSFRKYKISFVCMIGADHRQEMEQFHIVNSTSKPVPTDLALQLLRDRSQNDDILDEQLRQSGKNWKVVSLNVIEKLAEESEPWKGRIRFPNEKKERTTISSSALVQSLKTIADRTTLLQQPYTVEYRVRVLDAYWSAIATIYGKAFTTPSQYNLQAGIGAVAMHGIFPVVQDLVRRSNDSIEQKESYVKQLRKPLSSISGRNGVGSRVRGVNFWRSGKAGGAAQYSGESGRKALIDRLLGEFDGVT